MKLNRLILILLLMVGIVYGNDLIVTNNGINCIIKNTLNKNYDLSEKGVWKYALKDKRDSRYMQLNTIDGENVIEIDADQKSGSYGIVLSTKKLTSGFKENLKEGDYLTYIRLKANDDITVNIVSGNSEFLNTAKDYKVKIGKSFQWIKIPLKYKTILGYARDHVGIGFKDIKNKIYIDKIIFIKPDQCQDIKQYSINIIPDSLSKKIPTSFNFDINVSDNVGGLKVKTTKGETATVIRGKGGFPDGNINITPIDNNTWKVTYNVSKLSPTTATSNNIGLTFYALDSDGNTLVQKTLTVKAYKEDKVDLQKVLTFLEKSSVLNKLDLGVPSNIHTHFSRAEASIILYEFLKLKDSNFALPYGDVGFYKNPFADIDPSSDYYKSVITLANYKGDDNITVFTDKYGEFNPLHNVTRFQFVKMIVEGLNLPKSKDFSNIKGFDDYSQLADDAKMYYATAVKYGLIKGDNNKLLPYDKLTMFQALTILGRALDMNFTSNKEQFNEPDLTTGEIGNPLGIIPEDQDYDPTVTPIKINNITTQKEGNCTKLTAVVTLDTKANGKDYYVWNANFGYFKKTTPNNKEVLFCPSTKQPNVDYNIHLLGGDRYMNFAEYNITLNKNNYEYVKNIADTNPSEVKSNVSLSIKTHLMQENHLFVISKSGSLYEHNLNIGLEKVAVTLQNENGKTYTVDNVKWDDNSIYFVVPSVKEFYGKFITVKVDYGTNDKYESKTFDQVMYQENFIINGTVQADKTGNYPKYVTINSKEVNVLNGKFMYIAPDGGNYKISIDKNYQTINATLTDENPRLYVYINYIDLDYDNDGTTDNGTQVLTKISLQYTAQYLQNNQFKLNWDIKNAKAVRFEYSFDNQHWNKFDLINLLVSKKRQSIKEIKEAKNYQTIYFRANVLDKNNNHIYKIKELSYTPPLQGGGAKFTEIPAKTHLWAYQHGATNSADISWTKIIDSHHKLNVDHYEVRYGKSSTSDRTVLKFNDNSNPNNFLSSDTRIINGLEDGTSYYFQVRGCNDLGCGEWSNADFVTISVPHPPKFNTSYQYPKDGATGISKVGNLAWAASDKNNDQLVYRIKFGKSPNDLRYVSGWINDTSVDFTDLHMKKLSPNTKYYWQVVVAEKGHRGDEAYYGGAYPTTPVWSFTTTSDGYDLTITDAKLTSPLKPDSYATFVVTVKNIGNQPAPSTIVQAYYKKGDKVTPFRVGGELSTGKTLSPGESATINMKVKFQDYIIQPNQYNGNIEYDNILATGKSDVIFDMPYLKYDAQDTNFQNNKKDIVINYENQGAPNFEYFDVRFNGFSMMYPSDSYKDKKFYAIAGKKLQIVANVVDDVRCDHAKIEYKSDEDNTWHLIKEFKDNKSDNMNFSWKDKNGNQQGSSNSYNWTIPKSLKDTNIQLKVTVYDDQGLASSKTSQLFPVHSNFLELKNISLDKKEYKIGDKVFVSFIAENDNPIIKIKVILKQKDNNKAVGVYEKYDEHGLKLNNKITIQLPDDNYYTADNSYLEITLRDIYDNEKTFETPIFKLDPKSNLPQFFSNLIELYKVLNTNFPTDKDIVNKQSSNKILALKLDDNDLIHTVIESKAEYMYKVKNGGSYKIYSASNSKYLYIVYDATNRQIVSIQQILQTTKDQADKSGLYFKDFALIDDKPVLLFGENKFNQTSKYIYVNYDGTNFTSHEILNSQYVKGNEIKFLKNNNNIYVTWVDTTLGTDGAHRRNKYLKVYPSIGDIGTFADFYLDGNQLKIVDGKYLFANCKIYNIDTNMKVTTLAKKYNFSCSDMGEFKNYNIASNIIDAIGIYKDGEQKVAFIDKQLNVSMIVNDRTSPITAIFDNFTIVDGTKSGSNYLDYYNSIVNKKYTFEVGDKSLTIGNYNLVDINKNKVLVVATFGKTYISIADISKDIVPPVVHFTNENTMVENGKDILLKWSAKDNQDELTKLELMKIENGQESVIKTFTDVNSHEYTYHIATNADLVQFKIVAYDLSGNKSYDILPVKVFKPIHFDSFSTNKTTLNLGEKIIFSWKSDGDKNTLYTIYKKSENDNDWTKLCDVRGEHQKVYTVKDFVGKYQFKITANGSEMVCPDTVMINGDLLQFNEKDFYPSGTIVKKDNFIMLKWDDNAKNTLYYDIWIKNNNEDTFKKIGVSSSKFYNYLKDDNKPFTWKIGLNYKGRYIESQEFNVTIDELLPPKINAIDFNITDNKAYVDLNFTKVQEAVQYEILRSNCNEIFQNIAYLKENSFRDNGINYGQCYSYKVVSIAENGALSEPSQEYNISAILRNNYSVTIDNKNNSTLNNNFIMLKYHPSKKVSYENYEIRLGTDLNNLNLYTITTNRDINITNLDYATTYYVEIYPLDFNNNRLSVIPAKLVFTTGFDNRVITEKPIVGLDEVSDNYDIISWNEIANSDAYEVYRSDDNISYEFLFRTKDTKFIDNINLLPGKIYFYKIKALNGNTSTISNALKVKIPNEGDICTQVITHAYDPTTGEEKDFATPCDVPKGWVVGKAPDSDGDGVNDIKDAYPNDPSRWQKSDNNTTVDLTKGLVAWYKFDGNADDSSGNGNDGVEHGGATYVAGVIGKAKEFTNGYSYTSPSKEHDYISIPNSIKNNNFSISLWVKFIKLSSTNGSETLFSYGLDSTSSKDFFGIWIDKDSKISASEYDSNGQYSALRGIKIGKDIYHNVVVLNNNKQLKLYIDGNFIDQNNSLNLEFDQNDYLRIASHEWWNGLQSTRFNGLIDDLRIYNRALNDNEIKSLYKMGGEINSNFHILKGWNLKSLPTNKEVNITDFNNANIVWKWDGKDKTWNAWSPDTNIMQAIKQNQFKVIDSIKPGEGFWILSAQESGKSFDGQPYGLEKLQLTKGWNLVGFGKNISIDTLKDIDIKTIWQYINGKWSIWGKNIDASIYDNYPKIQDINATQGFWIDSNSDYNITKKPKENNTTNKIIIKEGENAKIMYDLGSKIDCSINFADGKTKTLDQCSGDIEHTYQKPGVYVPRFYSDNQEVNNSVKDVVIVENNNSNGFWDGYVTSLNNYVEPNENIGDFYTDNTLYIAPKFSEKGYYWTQFRYYNIDSFQNITANNFTITAKLKNSDADGGLSAYDAALYIQTDDGKSIGASFMGESWAQEYVHIRAGDAHADGLSELILDLSNYRNIKYVVKDGKFTIYADNNKLYTLPFTDEFGKIVGISVSFKGSGRLDSINLYNENNVSVYSNNFPSLPSF